MHDRVKVFFLKSSELLYSDFSEVASCELVVQSEVSEVISRFDRNMLVLSNVYV